MWLVVRAIGLLFLLIALGLVVFALLHWSRGGQFEFLPLGQLWFSLDPGSLNLFQAVTERYVSVWLWDSILAPMLLWNSFFFFLIPGLILAEFERIVKLFRKLTKAQQV